MSALLVAGAAAWLIFWQHAPLMHEPVAVAKLPPPVVVAAPPPRNAPPAGSPAAAPDKAEAAQDDDGDSYSYERTSASAIVDTATGRRIPLNEEAGWEAVALTGADGGLAAVAYLFAYDDTPGACGDPRFLIVGESGSMQLLAFDGTAGPNGVKSGIFAIHREGNDRIATVAGQRVLAEKQGETCIVPQPDGGAHTQWVLVDPYGNLQPMRTMPVP